MANGKTSLDREGCEFGRIVNQEFTHYKEQLNKMDLKMDKILLQLGQLKENQDRSHAFTVIGNGFVKHLISVIVGAASAAALLLFKGGL